MRLDAEPRLRLDRGAGERDAGALAAVTRRLRLDLWREAFRLRALDPRERAREANGDARFGPPRTPAEMELLRVVKPVLCVDACAPDADLREHGLTAERAREISRRLGARLDPADVLRLGTVAAMARALGERGRAGPPATGLVRLRAGSGPALFCLHPLDGGCLWYYALADQLRSPAAVWGIGCAGLVPGGPIDRSIGAMAARYLADIRRVQPRGPYHLLGWSMGGLLAWELASLVEREGEVARPMLMDTVNQAVVGRFGLAGASVDRIVDHIRFAELEPPWADAASLRRHAEVCLANVHASEGYVPPPLTSVPLLFRAVHDYVAGGFRHPDQGWWGACRTALEIQLLPGSHLAIMKNADARARLCAHLDTVLSE